MVVCFIRILMCLILIPISVSQVYAQSNTVHRLGIRTGSPKNVFYDTVTGQTIQLRGNNYIRVKEFPNGNWNISDFVPGEYNHDVRASVLATMKNDGYNAIRFFIDEWYIIENNSLSDGYISNLADYMKLAAEYGMYVQPTFRRQPHTATYRPVNTDTRIQGAYHEEYLIKGFVEGKKKYIGDVITALKNKGVPMEVVLGWSIDNEPYFENNLAPISLSSGTITAPNGKSYDMANSTQKNLMMDESMIYAMNEVRNVIHTIDSQAIVGITLFSPGDAGNVRLPRTRALFLSSADFIGFNIYAMGQSLTGSIDSLGMGTSKIPVVISEYGTTTAAQSTITGAANAFKGIQTLTCSQYAFSGWLAYEWDTTEYDILYPNGRYWHVAEGNGTINRSLAPRYRANPCLNDAVTALGNFESISPTGLVTGWVYDPEQPGLATVNFYLDAAYPNTDWSNLVGRSLLTGTRTDILNTNPWMKYAPIGFTFQIPMAVMADGKNHTIYAQSTDKLIDGTTSSYQLPGSGKAVPHLTPTPLVSVSCSGTVPAGVCAPTGGTYVLAITNLTNAASVLFATWNTANALDDQMNYPATNQGNGTWYATINRASHPGDGMMNSNVWYTPNGGTNTWCRQISLPICGSVTTTPTVSPSHTPPTPTISTSKTGDANGDARVDGLDYVIWLNHYGSSSPLGPTDGDFNRDGKVDGIDYVSWLANYGR